VACRSCRTKLSVSRLVNATGGWDHIAQFGPSPSDFLKVHYPSMVQHGCRLLVVYTSMYTCCAPYETCDCAPEGAEVGIHIDSFKLWEDKDAAEQFAHHQLKVEPVPAMEHPPAWGNYWWNDWEEPDQTFRSVVGDLAAGVLED